MAGFDRCPACAGEAEDPESRRFNDVLISCGRCGPRLWYETTMTTVPGSDPALAAAQQDLALGRTVAIKGVGGYQLACDASSKYAVEVLRLRRHQKDRPLAVMVPDLASAATLVHVSDRAEELLFAPQRPVVVLRRREEAPISAAVASGSPYLAVMLPHAPVHHLLFSEVGAGSPPAALVVTPGGHSGESICFEDHDARRRMAHLADGWLVHDRPIHVPCGDSVLLLADGEELPIRRSRGYAPMEMKLPFDVAPTVAVGTETSNTFCVARSGHAWVSQHIGHSGGTESIAVFDRAVGQLCDLQHVRPVRAVVDAHSDYQTRHWAESHFGEVTEVQHQHAHVASVMAEHGLGLSEEVIGFVFDSSGQGRDGAIWGGEVLVGGYLGFDRPAHLRYTPLPGGDTAARRPYRVALSLLWALGMKWSDTMAPVRVASTAELGVLSRQLQKNLGCVPTSSMGRLFDAVSSLLDIRHEVSYSGQAADELEALASSYRGSPPGYRFGRSGAQIDPAPVIGEILGDLRRGVDREVIAAGFLDAVAVEVAGLAEQLSRRTGITTVALTGRLFQHVTLLRMTRAELAALELDVITNRVVPPNDAGVSLGQVVMAGAAALAGREASRRRRE
jgi:hydrogenase maturation protein HypF